MVPQGNGIHKSGRTTYTTTGVFDLATTTIPVDLLWAGTTKKMLYQGVTIVLHAGQGEGDSGASVFAGNGTPYTALGILIAGAGSLDSNGVCNNGSLCRFAFFKWSNIEAKLNVGTINPITP